MIPPDTSSLILSSYILHIYSTHSSPSYPTFHSLPCSFSPVNRNCWSIHSAWVGAVHVTWRSSPHSRWSRLRALFLQKCFHWSNNCSGVQEEWGTCIMRVSRVSSDSVPLTRQCYLCYVSNMGDPSSQQHTAWGCCTFATTHQNRTCHSMNPPWCLYPHHDMSPNLTLPFLPTSLFPLLNLPLLSPSHFIPSHHLIISSPSLLPSSSLLFKQIIFESECASTIAIAKENITRLANYRRIQLEEKLTAVRESVPSFIGLVSEHVSVWGEWGS